MATALATIALVYVVQSAGPSFMSLVNYQVPVWAVTAPGRHRLPRVQAFVEFLAERFAPVPRDWRA